MFKKQIELSNIPNIKIKQIKHCKHGKNKLNRRQTLPRHEISEFQKQKKRYLRNSQQKTLPQ